MIETPRDMMVKITSGHLMDLEKAQAERNSLRAENSLLVSALNKAVDLLCDIPLHEEDDALILRREEILDALKTPQDPASETGGGP